MASRTSATIGAEIARAFSAPAARIALQLRLVVAELLVALAHRRQIVTTSSATAALKSP